MKNARRRLIAASALLTATIGGLAAASAQPLAVTVNPLAAPFAITGTVLSAPFALLAPPPAGAYDYEAARANSVSIRPDGFGVVAQPALRQIGPRYDNPAASAGRAPVVLTPGAIVPSYITTQVVENVSAPGLARGGRYEYFVSPERNIVYLDRGTRQVVLVTR